MRGLLFPLGLTAAALAAVPLSAAAQTRTIVIDPGHGGSDPGGVGNGLQEKNIVLDVGRRFKALLDADTADQGGGGSWIALLTRDDDTFVSLSARAAFANAEDADRFMSIHSNAFGSASANGTETFSFPGSTTGAAMRNLVQEEMIAAWGLTNRGNKTANFAVLRETAMPAELHELAFITNAGDAAKLASPTERQKAAVAHLRAIQRHFGIAPNLPDGEVDGSGTVGKLAGRVVDDLGPVSAATVALDTGPEVVTPKDGSFVFEKVPAGTRVLTVAAEGHEQTAVEIDVAAGVRSESEVFLARTEQGAADRDAGVGGGAGGDPAEADHSGCGCRVPPGSGIPGVLLLLIAALASLRPRRRG